MQNKIVTGGIAGQLMLFFFPIFLGTLFQQLYNTVDTVIVGQLVGTHALAAVGATGVLVQLLVGLFTGLSSGASVVIAQSVGARDEQRVEHAVHTAMVLALLLGAAFTLICLAGARLSLELMHTPAEILDDAALYLRLYFLGLIPQMVYNVGTAILRGVGDSRRPLYFLIAASLVNIGLDLWFVVGLRWGVAGVAVATVASQVVSAVLVLRCLAGAGNRPWRLDAAKLRIDRAVLADICRIGLPAAVQSSMYTGTNIIIQAGVNTFGTATIAAWTVYGKIDFLFWSGLQSMGLSVTTFVGQNFGAREYERVKRGTKTALGLAVLITLVIGIPMLLLPRVLFALFTSDAAVGSVGVQMMRFMVPCYPLYLCIEILSGALRGCGDVRTPTVITIVGICAARVAWMFTVVPVWHTLTAVMMSYPITWILTSAAYLIYYLRGGWLTRRIAAQPLSVEGK